MRANGEFRPRAEMENDRTWKQVIPYLVLRDGPRYFLMRRTQAGTDARLHDRWSIGVGGHLNPGDGDLTGVLRREWREEVAADFEPAFTLIGLLITAALGIAMFVMWLAGARARTAPADTSGAPEDHFPTPLVALHGIAAVATPVLYLVAAFTAATVP